MVATHIQPALHCLGPTLSTISLQLEVWGSLRRPTSSWKVLRPLDYVFWALRALKPCDPCSQSIKKSKSFQEMSNVILFVKSFGEIQLTMLTTSRGQRMRREEELCILVVWYLQYRKCMKYHSIMRYQNINIRPAQYTTSRLEWKASRLHTSATAPALQNLQTTSKKYQTRQPMNCSMHVQWHYSAVQ